MRCSKGLTRILLAYLCLALAALGTAQVGQAVSDIVTVPHTDYSVTGPPPYECLSEEESMRLRQDPVHRFQVWLFRTIESVFGEVLRLQRHTNCATACARIPASARVITEIRPYYATAPDGTFKELPLGVMGEWARWVDNIEASEIVGDERLVCLQFDNWVHAFDRRGYFIVYYEY